MKLTLPSRRDVIAGAAVFLLAVVCGVLAVLQYRWIGQIADAEQQRLHQELQRNLNLVRRDFNSQIAAVSSALVPTAAEVEQQGRDKSYLECYLRAGKSQQKFFSRVALAVPERSELDLFVLDSSQNSFRKADWPLGWAKLREGLSARLSGGPPPLEPYRPDGVIEFPRFDGRPGTGESSRRSREQNWLIVELDQNYLRSLVLPALLQRYLGESGQPQYSVIVSATSDPRKELYRWGPKTFEQRNSADAWVTLLELESNPFRGLRGPGAVNGAPNSTPPAGAEPSGSPPPGRGVWTLRVNHPAGSLENIVERARRRNLFLAAGLLSLLIVTVVALIRFTRGTEKLAEMQMNFVSGISHELRTPLSVIRAAGFNLRTKFAGQPEQVAGYGKLIQDESEKLTALVEQILRYGSAESGRILGARELIEIAALLEESLPDTRQALADAGVTIEERLADGLPSIKADKESLKHALRNLLENAVKHGNKEHARIRIRAEKIAFAGTPAVQIGIQDNGPGIPTEERKRVFEPFFRGKLARENQVHGTGLGLNLAKRIIEAHGGTLVLRSVAGAGAEFVATIPAANSNDTAERNSGRNDESTNSFD
jgi:signal transduction histidine kinase